MTFGLRATQQWAIVTKKKNQGCISMMEKNSIITLLKLKTNQEMRSRGQNQQVLLEVKME